MGKVIKVLELVKQIETKEHVLEVYAVFKDLKYGNIYAIYKDSNDLTNDTLHYASSHIKENILVLLNIKDREKIEPIVKEFVWSLINNKENPNFQIFDISNIDKAEIISSNTLLVKEEVLNILNDKTIPKKIDKNDISEEPKKMSSSSKILLTGFIVTFLIIVVFFIVNGKEIFKEVTTSMVCINSTYDKTILANINTEDTFIFNEENNLIRRNRVITYTFDNIESYNEYKRLGLYYKYEPVVSNSTLTYISDDINNIYTIKDNMTTEKEYFEPIIYDEVIKFMKDKKYICDEVSE